MDAKDAVSPSFHIKFVVGYVSVIVSKTATVVPVSAHSDLLVW